VLGPDGKLTTAKPKPYWQPSWLKQHDRIMESIAAVCERVPLVMRALDIINSKRIWMRNTRCMSDYREVGHGVDVVNRYFATGAHKQTFDAALNDCHGGLFAGSEIVRPPQSN